MASFTDTQMPRFNPYIQQQPVEAMAKVGMQKQQAYEEGVQKIQTQIDNIAGLDVVRDVDKAYLQSKMNQLGNSLRTVASGDFSNFQLVNSVGGMTKQVVRDRGVQNAVNSTAKMRKEQEFMEEERKKGELNPANEYVFNKQLGSWLNNNDVHQGFNAKYDKFFDVDKFTRETFAALKPDGFTMDQIFKTDGAGNPIRNSKTGAYELSPSMARLKKEGMMPEKVQQTINHIFNDPRVSKQLQINGQYTYRGSTPGELATKLLDIKEGEINTIDKTIMDLTMRKSMLPNGVEKTKLQNDIDEMVTTKNTTVDGYNKLIANVSENSDAVRGMLYKGEEKAKYKGMYTSLIEERTVHANPAWDANFKMQQEANEMARHRDTMQMSKLKMQQDERLAIMKMSSDYNIAALKTEKEAAAANANYTTSDIDAPSSLIEAHRVEGQAAWDTYTKSTDDLFLQTGLLSKDYLKIVKDANPGIDQQEVMKIAVNNMAKKSGMSPSEFRAQQYNRAVQLMNDNPKKLTPEMQAMKYSVENAGQVFKAFQDKKERIDAKAPMRGLESYKDTADFKFEHSPTGVISREDQLDIALMANERGKFFASDEVKAKAKAAEGRLTAKGYNVATIDRIINVVHSKSNTTDVNDPNNKPLFGFKKLLDAASSEQFNSSLDKRAAAIKEYSNFAPSVSKSIDTGEPKIDKAYRQNMKTFIGTYARAGQNESPGFMNNVDKMTLIASDDSKGSIEMRATKSSVTGEIVTKAIFTDADGKFAGEMTVSGEQASSVGFHPETKYSTPEMRYVENKLAVTGNGSTAYGDVSSFDTYAYNDVGLNKTQFPKLAGTPIDVKGNLKAVDIVNADGSVTPMYYNYLYVNDDGFKFIKAVGTPKPTVEEAIGGFQSISPQQLNQLVAEERRKTQKR